MNQSVSKLRTLVVLTLGGGATMIGYNLYTGDYRTYARYVMPTVHMLWPSAEQSHVLGVKAAKFGVVPRVRQEPPEMSPLLRTTLCDCLVLDNPIGLAAGFDKDGEALTGLSHFGFGFLEIGSTTPLPQSGNLCPRVFRLTDDRAIINRYGFNSYGHDAMVAHLHRQAEIIQRKNLIVGVNLGKNRDQTDAPKDYITGLQRFHPLDMVHYFVINISSPNTPNLRAQQQKDQLICLLERVLREKYQLEQQQQQQQQSSNNNNISGKQQKKPLFLKLSPDLSDVEQREIAPVLLRYATPASNRSTIDGLIISNTTVQRPDTIRTSDTSLVEQQGGLSGPPLKQLSTEMIRSMYLLTGGKIPIIGVGGVESGLDAYEKIRAGASVVQLYTSMAYFGPPIVSVVKQELAVLLAHNGYKNVSEAIGADHREQQPTTQRQLRQEQKKA